MIHRDIGSRVGASLVRLGVALAGLIVFDAMLKYPTAAAYASEVGDNSNFNDALAQTYQTNPVLLSARAKLRAVNEELAKAYGLGRPSLDVVGESGFSHLKNKGGSTAIGGDTEDDLSPWSAVATVKLPVYNGRKSGKIESANAQISVARAELWAVEQSVFFAAVQAYTAVRRDQAVVSLNKRNLEMMRKEFTTATERQKAGMVTGTDVAQAEARFAEANSQLALARATLVKSAAAFEKIVGRPPGELSALPGLPDIPASSAEVLRIALQDNPVLRAAEGREAEAYSELQAAYGALHPSLDLIGTAELRDEQSLRSGRNEKYEVLVRARLPLYQQGIERANVRQQKQIVQQQGYDVSQARREVEERVRILWAQMQSAKMVLQASEQSVKANQLALKGVREEVKLGERSMLDLLNAEQEALNASVTAIDARSQYFAAAYEIWLVMGKLTAKELDLDVTLHDPRPHHEQAARSRFATE